MVSSIARYFGHPTVIENTARYFKRMDEAKLLDPEAFQPVMMPHYTDEQLWRQQQAMERVSREHPELAPKP